MIPYFRRHFCTLSGGTILSAWARHRELLSAALVPHDATRHYTNPIIAGDHPDAGAIRVGSDY